MNALEKRLSKDLDAALGTVSVRGGAKANMTSCQGDGIEDILDAVWYATPDEDEPIFDEIVAQANEYSERPPQRDGLGREYRQVHGFIQWLWLLRDGVALLPDTIPSDVMKCWAESYNQPWHGGYADVPSKVSSLVGSRCESCSMVLPASWPHPGWDHCPICGSDRLARRDLSKAIAWHGMGTSEEPPSWMTTM